jgi:uncharacterized membrane protein HdeD (DUF308 family)
MAELLRQNWWALAARGVAALLFGTALLLLPDLTLDRLIGLFSAYAFADGVLAIIAALRPPGSDRRAAPRREALLLEGVAGLALGLAVALWPGETVLATLLLVGSWALATGTFELLAALRLRRAVPAVWLLGVGGIASLALGVLLVAAPLLGILAFVWYLGVYALLFGALLLLLALRLRVDRGTTSDDASAGTPVLRAT